MLYAILYKYHIFCFNMIETYRIRTEHLSIFIRLDLLLCDPL